MHNYVHILCRTIGVKQPLRKISYVIDLSPCLGVLDVSATRQMHSNYSMLALTKVDEHSPMHALVEAGKWHHLPGRGN